MQPGFSARVSLQQKGLESAVLSVRHVFIASRVVANTARPRAKRGRRVFPAFESSLGQWAIKGLESGAGPQANSDGRTDEWVMPPQLVFQVTKITEVGQLRIIDEKNKGRRLNAGLGCIIDS